MNRHADNFEPFSGIVNDEPRKFPYQACFLAFLANISAQKFPRRILMLIGTFWCQDVGAFL
jgi:hypothetical protein